MDGVKAHRRRLWFAQATDRRKSTSQVDDRPLTTSILQLGMVAHVDNVEHDVSRAEVERHTVTHMKSAVAVQYNR